MKGDRNLVSFALLVSASLISHVTCQLFEGGVPDATGNGSLKPSWDEKESTVYNSINDSENIYNPVLQNSSALGGLLQNEGQRNIPLKTEATHEFNSDGTRRKRSLASLWCGSGDQCSRSLCSWEERLDVQTTRTPISMKYAVCRTRGCDFSFANMGQNVNDLLGLYTTCDVVRTDIRVLEGGRVKWLTGWPIACMCTRRPQFYGTDVTLSRNSPDAVPGMMFAAGEVDAALQRTGAHDRPMMDGTFTQGHLSRSDRRQIRRYGRQQGRRHNVESFDALMRRRQRERNES